MADWFLRIDISWETCQRAILELLFDCFPVLRYVIVAVISKINFLVFKLYRQAKDVIKSIKKRVGSKNANTQLFAVTVSTQLLDTSPPSYVN